MDPCLLLLLYFCKLGYESHLYYNDIRCNLMYESVIFIPFSYKTHVPNEKYVVVNKICLI